MDVENLIVRLRADNLWQKDELEYVQPLCRQAADALTALQAEVVGLKAAIQRQAAAVRTLHHNEQTEINVLRQKSAEAYRAVATLDSEREMNALLTEENAALQARIDALTAERDVARGAALEEAAKVADPPLMHRKGKPGLWRIRRAQIASDIRALKEPQQ